MKKTMKIIAKILTVILTIILIVVVLVPLVIIDAVLSVLTRIIYGKRFSLLALVAVKAKKIEEQIKRRFNN